MLTGYTNSTEKRFRNP